MSLFRRRKSGIGFPFVGVVFGSVLFSLALFLLSPDLTFGQAGQGRTPSRFKIPKRQVGPPAALDRQEPVREAQPAPPQSAAPASDKEERGSSTWVFILGALLGAAFIGMGVLVLRPPSSDPPVRGDSSGKKRAKPIQRSNRISATNSDAPEKSRTPKPDLGLDKPSSVRLTSETKERISSIIGDVFTQKTDSGPLFDSASGEEEILDPEEDSFEETNHEITNPGLPVDATAAPRIEIEHENGKVKRLSIDAELVFLDERTPSRS